MLSDAKQCNSASHDAAVPASHSEVLDAKGSMLSPLTFEQYPFFIVENKPSNTLQSLGEVLNITIDVDAMEL